MEEVQHIQLAGIQGFFSGEEFTAVGNKVINCNISCSSKEGHGTGILGSWYPYHFYNNSYGPSYIKSLKVNIEDCKVEGSKINGTRIAAGILGDIYNNNSMESVEVNINNCLVDGKSSDEEINGGTGNNGGTSGDNKTIRSEFGEASGIFAGMYSSSCKNTAINLTNNVVDNASISVNTRNNSDRPNAAGILGYVWNSGSDSKTDININSNKTLNTEIEAKGYLGSYSAAASGQNVSGIFGSSYDSGGENNICIEDCEVNNVKLDAHSANIGGVLAVKYACYNTKSTVVKNCKVIDLDVAKSGMFIESIGGLIGYNYADDSSIEVDNCMVQKINIHKGTPGGYKNVGGLIGGIYEGKEIKITNSKCVGKNTNGNMEYSTISAGVQIGGIVGNTVNFSDTEPLILDNVECSNLKVQGEKSENGQCEGACKVEKIMSSSGSLQEDYGAFGGLIGHFSRKNTQISNAVVSDIEVDVDAEEVKNYHLGGIAGSAGTFSSGNNCTISNVKVDKIDLKSNGNGGVAGAIADLGAKTTVDGLEITNSDIELDEQKICSYGNIAGGVFGVDYGASGNDKHSMRNIKVDKVNVTASGRCKENTSEWWATNGMQGAVGGFMAVNIGNMDVENLEMKDCTVKSENNSVHPVGGVIGINGNSGNLSIDDIELEEVSVSAIKKDESGESEETEEFEIKKDKAPVAGIVAVDASSGTTVISNAELEDIELRNDWSDNTVAGGIAVAGVKESNPQKEKAKTVKMSDCKIDDIVASGQYVVGGFLGCGIGELDNCTVNNPKIMAETENGVAGGIVGIAVEDSKLSNVAVKADEGNITEEKEEKAKVAVKTKKVAAKNQKVENTEVNSMEKAVNIAETAETEDTTNISGQSNVNNSDEGIDGILANELSNEGNANGKLDENSTSELNAGVQVMSEDTTQDSESSKGGEDGVTKATEKAGDAEDAKDAEETGEEVEDGNAEEDEENGQKIPKQYGIYSDFLAGGIAGMDSGILLSGNVENIIVKTKVEAKEPSDVINEHRQRRSTDEGSEDGTSGTEEQGAEAGTPAPAAEEPSADEPTNDKDLTNESIGPCADAVQARSLSDYLNTVIKNVKVITGSKEELIKDNNEKNDKGNGQNNITE